MYRKITLNATILALASIDTPRTASALELSDIKDLMCNFFLGET
jgi:hypothetical protein